MRVAVFRTREDGERTAALLARRGHEAMLAPVMEITRVAHMVPRQRYDAVVLTSAHGAEALDAGELDRVRHLPCFCVGGRTARTAASRGFGHVRAAHADAAALAALLVGSMPAGSAILFVTGRHRKADVDRRLTAAGHRVTVIEAYDAQAVGEWPAAFVEPLGAGQVEAALHYSRRSADLALANARLAFVGPAFLALDHYCLSADAGGPLRGAGCTRVTVASEPTESSLLDTLPASGSPALRGRADR